MRNQSRTFLRELLLIKEHITHFKLIAYIRSTKNYIGLIEIGYDNQQTKVQINNLIYDYTPNVHQVTDITAQVIQLTLNKYDEDTIRSPEWKEFDTIEAYLQTHLKKE